MKREIQLILLVSMILFISCKEKIEKKIIEPKIETKEISDDLYPTVSTVEGNNNTSEPERKIDSLKVREYAQYILNGEYPSDDDVTYDCINQIFSTNGKELDFYFRVFREIVRKSDGALAEGIGMYVMSFIKTKTDYFFKEYQNFKLDEKERIAGFLAFELYYSQNDQKSELKKYFSKLSNNLNSESNKSSKSLIELRDLTLIELNELLK